MATCWRDVCGPRNFWPRTGMSVGQRRDVGQQIGRSPWMEERVAGEVGGGGGRLVVAGGVWQTSKGALRCLCPERSPTRPPLRSAADAATLPPCLLCGPAVSANPTPPSFDDQITGSIDPSRSPSIDNCPCGIFPRYEVLFLTCG